MTRLQASVKDFIRRSEIVPLHANGGKVYAGNTLIAEFKNTHAAEAYAELHREADRLKILLDRLDEELGQNRYNDLRRRLFDGL